MTKFKNGDLVKIKTIRGDREDGPEKAVEFVDLIGKICNKRKYESYLWDFKVEFDRPVGGRGIFLREEHFFMRSDLEELTDREKFLYLTYGSKVLQEIIKNEN